MDSTEITVTSTQKNARRAYCAVGLGVFALWIVTSCVRVLIRLFVLPAFPETATAVIANGGWMWALTSMLPMYLFGFPAAYLVMRFAPKHKIEEKKFGKRFVVTPFVALFLGIGGSLVGLTIEFILNFVLGMTSESAVQTMMLSGNSLVMFIFSVLVAPVIEELLFRKFIIDRTHIYGGALSVVVSAVMFGLFHGNIKQLFMATAIGLLFGYVYLKTGRIGYTILLHALVNALGNIMAIFAREVLPILTEMGADMDVDLLFAELPKIIGLFLYESLYYDMVVAGLVLFIIFVRKVSFEKEPLSLPGGVAVKSVILNVGMILFLLICTFEIISSIVPMTIPLLF